MSTRSLAGCAGLALLGTAFAVGAGAAPIAGFERSFAGFTVSMRLADRGHGTEGELAQRNELASSALGADLPALRRAIRHYLSGEHPYPRYMDWVGRGTRVPSSRQTVPISLRGWRVSLHLERSATETVRARIASDLVAAQFFGAGIYASKSRLYALTTQTQGLARYGSLIDLPDWETYRARLSGPHGERPRHRSPEVWLVGGIAHSRQLELTSRAKTEGVGDDGLRLAFRSRFLDALLEKKPYPRGIFAPLSQLSSDQAELEVEMALTLMPDAWWKLGRAEAVQLLRAHHPAFRDQGSSPYDNRLRTWLQSLPR